MPGFCLKALLASVLAGALAGVLSAAAAGKVKLGWVTAFVLAGFVLALLWGAVKLTRTTYTITSRRLRVEIGLLSRELRETRLELVQDVVARQTLLERVLGVGSVEFSTAGAADNELAFTGVSDPQRVVRTVDRALAACVRPTLR